MKKSEIIEGMLGLLSGPEHWCKYVLHEDLGTPAWCINGAIMQVATGHWSRRGLGNPDVQAVMEALRHKLQQDGWHDEIVAFNNDKHTEYEDVILLLKEAMYDAQAEEATAAIEENLAAAEAVRERAGV